MARELITVAEFLARTETSRVRDVANLGDGKTLSIQATAGHYCLPRSDRGPWTHVEVMVNDGGSEFDGELERWRNHEQMYAWLPITILEFYCIMRGGIVWTK